MDTPKSQKTPDEHGFTDLPEEALNAATSPTSFVELHRYREAISKEFASLSEIEDPDELLKQVRKLFVPHLPDITENILAIAKHGTSEGTQLSAAKLILSILGIVRAGKPETKANELQDLFKELAKND